MSATRQSIALQWSRTLTSAEIPGKDALDAARIGCFNGAALLRVRKCRQSSPVASRAGWLQWSRTLTSAEICFPSITHFSYSGRFNGAALLRVRKCFEVQFGAKWIKNASMEPHSYECGNGRILQWIGLNPCMLQWSRTLTSAEMSMMGSAMGWWATLQWSRTLTSAEIFCCGCVPGHIPGASMEPHSYECGNGTTPVPSAAVIDLLQWSRTLTSAEI